MFFSLKRELLFVDDGTVLNGSGLGSFLFIVTERSFASYFEGKIFLKTFYRGSFTGEMVKRIWTRYGVNYQVLYTCTVSKFRLLRGRLSRHDIRIRMTLAEIQGTFTSMADVDIF